MILATCLSVCLLAGVGQPPASETKPAPSIREFPAKDPQGKPLPTKPVRVADVIKGLGLNESKMSFSDEPPGKLRALSWSRIKLPGTEAEVDVEIHIAYTADVFSDKRIWDMKAVRAATILKVTITPHSAKID